jgi:hypothetical protein
MKRLIAAALALVLALEPAAWARLGSGPGSGITQSIQVTGITPTPNPCVGTPTTTQGTQLCSLLATTSNSGIPLLNPSFVMVNDAGTGVVISGSNIQAGATPLVAGSYSLTVSVTGSNCTNCSPAPQYTVPLTVSSSITITGITTSPSPVTTTAGTAPGTILATLTPTSTGGALTGATIACANCLSNEFQVGGTNPFNLEVGSGGVTAGTPAPTFTVTATNATNSPQTYPITVTVSSAPINLVSPVTCTAIATGCNGTVGDAQATSLGTLVPSQSGGSAGAITCNTTMPNNAGGRFQITSGCVLQAGATAYTAGSYSVTVAFSGASASANPYNLSFSVTVNPSGSVSQVQQRVVTNFGGSTTPAGFWMDVGQPFADGQIPAGDGVLWKTGSGTTITSQGDDCSHYPSGAVRFCSFTLLYPTALGVKAQDLNLGAYDNPGAGANNTCFSGTPTALITSHDFRLEATSAGWTGTGTISNGTVGQAGTTLTVGTTVTGALAIGQAVYGFGVAAGTTITGGSGSVWTVSVSQSVQFQSAVVPLSAGTGGTTYTMSANNEFTNEASTHTIMYRSGPEVCSYVISGLFWASNTWGGTSMPGKAWGALYIDARVDGTYRVWGKIFNCQPLATSTTQQTSCPIVGFAPDANGDAYSVKDYSLGTPILMGCAYSANTVTTAACVSGGHATSGLGLTLVYGSAMETLNQDGWPYDSQASDTHQVLPAFPLLVSANPLTRGWYDAMLSENIGYTTGELSAIYASTYTEGSYGPNNCAYLGGVGCDFGSTGASNFIGLISFDLAQCLLAGQNTSAGWRVCNNDRQQALTMDAVQMNWRDQFTGREVNLSSAYTPPTGTMNTFTTGGWGGLPSSGQITSTACGGFQQCQISNHLQTVNHQPNFGEGQCILTGQRPFCDLVMDQANHDIGSQNAGFRNTTVNGHAYSAVAQLVPQFRQNAWLERDISNASWLAPDFLADQVTANPQKGYLAALVTGIQGTLAYYNDNWSPPLYNSASNPLGIGPTAITSGVTTASLPEAIYWQAGYWMNVLYLDAARGLFDSTNCRNGSFTTAVASCPILTNYAHNFFYGAAVNGCMAFAAATYALSTTTAANPFAVNNSGALAQHFSDMYSGDVESNSVDTSGFALGTQTAGSTISLTYGSAPSPFAPTVGMNINFGRGQSYTKSGITIPVGDTVTSVASCGTNCFTLGLSAPMTGGTIPTNLAFLFLTWNADGNSSGVAPPSTPFPLVNALCPPQGMLAQHPDPHDVFLLWRGGRGSCWRALRDHGAELLRELQPKPESWRSDQSRTVCWWRGQLGCHQFVLA